jgi:hypothetical protein
MFDEDRPEPDQVNQEKQQGYCKKNNYNVVNITFYKHAGLWLKRR